MKDRRIIRIATFVVGNDDLQVPVSDSQADTLKRHLIEGPPGLWTMTIEVPE